MASYSEQPNKYVLSLDSLDLSLLPTYQSRLNSNTTSLWSASNLNGKTNNYFQFEIKPKTEKSSDIDESLDDSLLETTCYICNLKVPGAYITDHENSLKHQAYVKIADVVLDRARQHMLKRESRCNARKIDTMYFCGPCVIVVPATDKEDHEKSKLHKRSVSLDRLLYELVSLYTEDENETERTHKVDENFLATNSNMDDNGNNVNSEVDRNFENTVLISDVEACLNKHEIEKHKEIKVNGKENSNSPSVNTVTIETLDGHEIKISEDNFHGFMRIGKYHLQCKLCKMIIKNEEEHKTSKEHVNIILKPMNDKHCIRNLDDSWSHCAICNQIIDNSDVHALYNELHENLLQKALVVHKAPPNKFNLLIENGVSKVTDSSEYHCSTCNIGMHVNNTESHMNGGKHAMNSKSNLHYLMKQIEGAKDLICRVCQIHVNDNPKAVENHVNTTEHSNNLKDFLSNNHVRALKDEFYCKPCDVKFGRKNEFYHIEKLSHEVNLAAFEGRLGESNVDTKEESNSEKSPERPNVFYCHVCNVNIPNNPSNIKSHNDGSKHRKNVSNVLAEIDTAIERVAIESVTGVPYQMESTPNDKELRCKACNVIVPNKEANIDEHVKGSKHKFNEKKLMLDNNIEMKADKYVCTICNVVISTEQEYNHIKKPTHLTLLYFARNQDKSFKPETKENTPKDEHKTVPEIKTETEDVPKTISANLYSVLKHHFSETDDPDIISCRVCFTNIIHTELDVLNHANDKTHMTGYRDLMARNLIFETDMSTFFCGICNCLVPGKGEFHHVFGSRHAGNYTKVIAEERCEICDVATNTMEYHISTPQHMVKLKQRQTVLDHCEACNALIMKNEGNFAQHSENCDLMLKHSLVVKDKICFCIICDLYFARNLIEEHVKSNHHLLLLKMAT